MILCVVSITLTNVVAQTSEDIQKIIDQSDINGLNDLAQEETQKELERKQRILDYLASNPSASSTTVSGDSYGVIYDILGGKPIYMSIQNIDAAEATRTDFINSGNTSIDVQGENMTIHVWDGGPTRVDHEAFDNRVTIGDGNNVVPIAPNQVTSQNEFDQNGMVINSQHANHVTGTIVGNNTNANARGMAPAAEAVTHDWTGDHVEMTNAAANGMIISNHSYGVDANNLADGTNNGFLGAYIAQSQALDQIMNDAPFYLSVHSAGNDGQDVNNAPGLLAPGFDKLSLDKVSKNNLVVGSINNPTIGPDGELQTAAISAFSSQGPTDDFRIKPDICGMGFNVFSTGEIIGGNNAAMTPQNQLNTNTYANMSGTSMSSPNVTGSLALIQQLYNEEHGSFMLASTLKGLALHTADDILIDGPDAISGWGVLNAKVMAETVLDMGSGSIVEEHTLSNGETLTFTVTASGLEDLKASISWNDPAGAVQTIVNDATPRLVNDLDVRITQNGTTHLPFALTDVNTNANQDNIVDPFERIDIENPSGSYTVTISHKGTLDDAEQVVSLIVTGVSTSCVADVSISGFYSQNLTESSNSITTLSGTTFDPTKEITLNAGSYVLLNSSCTIEPTSGAFFLATAGDGCNGSNNARKAIAYKDELEEFDNNVTYNETEVIISVHPNPAQSGDIISFSTQVENAELFNIAGNQVQSCTSCSSLKIDDLELGMYLLNLDGESVKLTVE